MLQGVGALQGSRFSDLSRRKLRVPREISRSPTCKPSITHPKSLEVTSLNAVCVFATSWLNLESSPVLHSRDVSPPGHKDYW